MRIDKNRIRSASRYLNSIPSGVKFRIVASLPAAEEQAFLKRAGFGIDAVPGDSVLPPPFGMVATFNSDGRDIIRKDLPKENRYIRTVFWRWKEWAGRDKFTEREDYRDIYQDCYPKEHVEAPSAELTLAERAGQKIIISESLEKRLQFLDRTTHVINLFLEIFGFCEVTTEDLQKFIPKNIKRANWRLLPPGDYPWHRLKEHIESAVSNSGEDTQRVIWNRQETLQLHNPDEIFVGQGGFNDYLAYVFHKRGVVVLESVRKDNAIYVLGEDWKLLSQLSKGEILNGKRHIARIVHTKGWKAKLAGILARPKAA